MSPDAAGWAPSRAVPAQCVLCGGISPDVRHALIRFRDGDPYGSGPRCHDAAACWDRVMAQGEEWLVDDGRARGGQRPAPPEPPVPDGSSIVEELDFGSAPQAEAVPS